MKTLRIDIESPFASERGKTLNKYLGREIIVEDLILGQIHGQALAKGDARETYLFEAKELPVGYGEVREERKSIDQGNLLSLSYQHLKGIILLSPNEKEKEKVIERHKTRRQNGLKWQD